MERKDRIGKYVKLLSYLAAVVLINMVGITLFFRIDLTANQVYSLSAVSREVVSTLNEPLTINVFFTKDLPAPHNNTERYLRDLLEEYAINGNRYFNYRFYDVSPESESVNPAARENQALAKNYGIHPVQIQVIEEDEVKFKLAYMGLVLIHGDVIERIPTLTATEGLEYKLTTAIQKLSNKTSALLALKDKIHVRLYLSSSLLQVAPYLGLDGLSNLPAEFTDMVKTLNKKNYDRLELTVVDPTKENNLDAISQKHDLMALKWPDLPKAGVTAGKGLIGMVMELGARKIESQLLEVVRIPILGTQYNLLEKDQIEEIISANVESLVDINEDLGYLSSHGTPSISGPSRMSPNQQETMSGFSELARQNYTLKPVDLKTDAIPDSLKCLVIAGPTEKFSDWELYQIDQALMRGTSLALFLDGHKESMDPHQQAMGLNRGPSYIPIDTGLEKLLNHWGIRITKTYVMDKSCYKQQTPQTMGGGERQIYFAPVIRHANINNDLPFMKNIKGLITIKISPLELDEQRIEDNGLVATRMFTSSDQAWTMGDRINFNPMFLTPPPAGTEMSRFDLAYQVTGAFPSYFDGRPIPVKAGTPPPSEKDEKAEKALGPKETAGVDLSAVEAKGQFIAKGAPAKIILVASSDIISDTLLSAGGNSPNEIFAMNVIDSLNDRDDVAVMRSKEQRFNPLAQTSAVAKTALKYANIVGLPVLVVVFGLITWMRRRARKNRIRLMFASK